MIYLLHGPNTVDLDDRIVELCRDLDPTGFGVTRMSTADDSGDDIRSAVTATPFFGGQRVVNLSIGSATGGGGSQSRADSSIDTVIEITQTIPQTTTLILRNERTVPSNSRLIKSVQKQDGVIEAFPLLRGGDLIQWAIERGRMEGATLEQPAARRLLELLYPTAWNPTSREMRYAPTLDMRLIATEIAKLATAAGKGPITTVLVEELVADRSGFTAFKLNDDL